MWRKIKKRAYLHHLNSPNNRGQFFGLLSRKEKKSKPSFCTIVKKKKKFWAAPTQTFKKNFIDLFFHPGKS